MNFNRRLLRRNTYKALYKYAFQISDLKNIQLLWDNALVHCKDFYSYSFKKKIPIGQYPGKTYRQEKHTRRILGRGDAVTNQKQRKQDENALMKKGNKPYG